jgi:hypothetical protein
MLQFPKPLLRRYILVWFYLRFYSVTWAQVRLFYPGFFPIHTPRDRSGKAGGKCLKVNLTCTPITNNLVTRKRWKRSKVGPSKRTPLEACWNISKVIKSQCVKGKIRESYKGRNTIRQAPEIKLELKAMWAPIISRSSIIAPTVARSSRSFFGR